jgi:hypothetical protein
LTKKETVRCDPRNVILVAIEFPAIKPRYEQAFLDQFGTVFTYSRKLRHPRVFDAISPFPWFVGLNDPGQPTAAGYWDYDQLASMRNFPKTKLLSVVSSDKTYTRGHRDRIAFVDALKRRLGDRVDVFGRGRRGFRDKREVLIDYRYHVALENSSCRNGISEKLYDPFLTLTYPIYFGAPNVLDHFPAESMTPIDIRNPREAIERITRLLAEDPYDAAMPAMLESRRRVLEKYNLFAMLAEYIAGPGRASSAASERSVTLSPEQKAAPSVRSRLAGRLSRWLGSWTLAASKASRGE